MTTRFILVTVLGKKIPNFDDETRSRHHFWVRNACFWRRNPISSPFLVWECSILATRSFLVTVFGLEMLNFGDEARSRRRFWLRKLLF
ncbi:hypothetical protein NSQ82_02145 [Caldifermentibacillus hisashii]|uniref:hypothetical protein n=1 Tax=Caldifermentibacillus hisashii TaxID=996558 RepID=UPI0031B6B6CD